jgi:hypothetical protein
MSLKDLKSGIINQDWDVVRAAYENMTGETISPIAPVVPVGPQKRAAKKAAKKVAKKTTAKTAKQDKKGFILHEDNIERTNKPKFVKNLFEDFGDDPVPMTPEEEATLRKMNANRVVRPSDEVEAMCSVCKEVKKVRSILVAGKNTGSKFRCDKCIG